MSNFNPIEIVMQLFNILEVRLHEDCVAGDIVIFDMEYIILDNLKKVTPKLIKEAFVIYVRLLYVSIKIYTV